MRTTWDRLLDVLLDPSSRKESSSPWFTPPVESPNEADFGILPLLLVAVALVFSDQNLLAPNLSQAARDFGLDDQARDEKLGGGLAADSSS